MWPFLLVTSLLFHGRRLWLQSSQAIGSDFWTRAIVGEWIDLRYG
jgi:hypothetical protein